MIPCSSFSFSSCPVPFERTSLTQFSSFSLSRMPMCWTLGLALLSFPSQFMAGPPPHRFSPHCHNMVLMLVQSKYLSPLLFPFTLTSLKVKTFSSAHFRQMLYATRRTFSGASRVFPSNFDGDWLGHFVLLVRDGCR